MKVRSLPSPRAFVWRGISIGASALLAPVLFYGKEKAEKPEEEVSPAEDLMREHGVLKRVLLVYEEAVRRITANEELPAEAVMDSANIIRTFIEDYHEQLEEKFLFPRFKKAGKLTDLVDVLLQQHQIQALAAFPLPLLLPGPAEPSRARGRTAGNFWHEPTQNIPPRALSRTRKALSVKRPPVLQSSRICHAQVFPRVAGKHSKSPGSKRG